MISFSNLPTHCDRVETVNFNIWTKDDGGLMVKMLFEVQSYSHSKKNLYILSSSQYTSEQKIALLTS